MLRIGIIGYGRRIAHMARGLDIFGIPYRVAAIADPRAAAIQAETIPSSPIPASLPRPTSCWPAPTNWTGS